MNVQTFSIAVLGIVVPCVAAGVPLNAQESESALTGIWVLNSDLSDNPQGTAPPERRDDRRDRSAAGGFGRPGGGGQGGFGGGPGAGGGFGSRGSGAGERADAEDMAAMRQAMQSAIEDLMSAPRRMTIVVPDNEILLTYGDGRVVRLIPDERPHAGIAGNAMEVKRTTMWDGDRLVTQIELQSRIAFGLEQTYEVGPEGRRLVVTSRFESERFGNDEGREFSRVYERDVR